VVDFDYHHIGNPAHIHRGAVPNHGKHAAKYEVSYSPDFLAWQRMFKQPVKQAKYAEFIEDMIHTIYNPDAGVLLDAIKDFDLGRDIRFKSAYNDRSGSASITYQEDDRDLKTDLPNKITLVMPVFDGDTPREINAMVQYRVENGELFFIIKAPGIDKIIRDDIESLVLELEEAVDLPSFNIA